MSLSLYAAVVGIQRLRTVIAVLVLRRMKDDIAATQKLPEKLIQTHIVDLEDEEQNLYDALFSEARYNTLIPTLPT